MKPTKWKRLIIGKSKLQIAELLLADLIGYRKISLHRAEDADTIVALIDALDIYALDNDCRSA